MSKRLTEYSHGSGCGCKIAPNKLEEILAASRFQTPDESLIVGVHTGDDAAVIKWNDDIGIISTTDFFTPIVDDPFDFGRIAATNALSDIYAMGGQPMMAIAILGWPVERLATSEAAKVLEGAKETCNRAGISIAGGHSIDAPEPFFGLAVTGQLQLTHLKKNSTAQVGDLLFLTKPLGTGIVATAIKRDKVRPADARYAIEVMCTLNNIGSKYGTLPYIHAMTDVTGFGLAGHLIEMCQSAKVSAEIQYEMVPTFPNDILPFYLNQFIFPDNTFRNFSSYGQKITKLDGQQLQILCDPQTSGGLLVAVDPAHRNDFVAFNATQDQEVFFIGEIHPPKTRLLHVN